MMAPLTQDWSTVQSHYTRYRVPGMLALVKTIVDSPYREGLFPWTSHHDLCLTQSAVESPYRGPRRIIAPRADGTAAFRYVDSGMEAAQWRRTVKMEAAFTRLEQFFDELSWFVTYKSD